MMLWSAATIGVAPSKQCLTVVCTALSPLTRVMTPQVGRGGRLCGGSGVRRGGVVWCGDPSVCDVLSLPMWCGVVCRPMLRRPMLC
jgi:hypothetical protein